MKGRFAGISCAAVFLLIAGQALFVSGYVSHEHTFYFWDHAMYFNMVRQAYGIFVQSFASGWIVFQQSLAQNYNLLFALPSFLSFALFGSTRFIFILTNYFIFFLAYEGAVAFLLQRSLKISWPDALTASLASSFLIPPLWLPLLEGYPDSGAAACLVFAAALILNEKPESRFIWRALLAGLILGAAVLLRRHFVYPVLALLVTLAGLTVADLWRLKKNRGRALGRTVVYFIVCGAGFTGTLALIAPDFLYNALTVNYGALYLSYHQAPLHFLRFVLGGFGFGLLLAATGGMILLAHVDGKGRRLAFFAVLYACLWFVFWCLGPDQMGHHYILHALPLFVSIGLTGWALYLAKQPGRKKYMIGSALGLALFANSAWALWFSPTGVWPNDNGAPGVFSAPRPPVVRVDYDEWLKLADYLHRTTNANDRIMMVGSSFVFNQDLLRSVYTDILEEQDMPLRFVRTSEIDHEEPTPLNSFAAANVYLVPEPAQYHLDPAGQRVITAAANQFPPSPVRAAMFREDSAIFYLADGVIVRVWRRHPWTPVVLHHVLEEMRRDGPQDVRFAQDWVATALPLQAQIYTYAQNFTSVDGFFIPGHGDLHLFFDFPLAGGNLHLAFAAAGNCPDPRFHLATLTEDGRMDMAKDFTFERNVGETSQLLALPKKRGNTRFLELDLATTPVALCHMELRNLRIEERP